MAEELFPFISETTRANIKFFLDVAFQQHDVFKGIELFTNYVNSSLTEEEKEYADFCFQIKMEQLKNDQNDND